MRECMVTTMDNRNNPFKDYGAWNTFDSEHGYGTPELLAYFARSSTKLEEEEYHDEIERAIGLLLEFNPFGIHFKVYEDEADVLIPLANEIYYNQIATEESK